MTGRPADPSAKDVDLKLVRAFVEVARDLSFTRAARRIGVSQPRLSMRVQALEEQLRIALFRRTSRRVELSPAGSRFLASASRILAAVDEAMAVADDLRSGRGERLSIGATAFKVSQRWEILHEFMSSLPTVDLRVTVGRSPELFDQLRSGAVELAFALGPVPDDLLGEFISADRIGLTVPADAPLARTGMIGLDQLAGSRLAMFPPDPNAPLHERVQGWLAARGVTLIELPEPNAEAMTQFIREVGVGIVSAQWWTPEHTPGLAFVTIEEITQTLDLFLVRALDPLGPAADALWQIVRRRAEVENR